MKNVRSEVAPSAVASCFNMSRCWRTRACRRSHQTHKMIANSTRVIQGTSTAGSTMESAELEEDITEAVEAVEAAEGGEAMKETEVVGIIVKVLGESEKGANEEELPSRLPRITLLVGAVLTLREAIVLWETVALVVGSEGIPGIDELGFDGLLCGDEGEDATCGLAEGVDGLLGWFQ
jgi:hypothetical protein